jgi:hypothetical protein
MEVLVTQVERIFCEDIEELERLLANPTLFGARSASAVLRRILCDDTPLLHAVSRERGFKPRFEVVGRGKSAKHIIDMMPAGSTFLENPRVPTGSDVPSSSLNLDEFLAHMIAYWDGEPISVKNFIRYVANNAGGIHWDPNPSGATATRERVHQIRSISSRVTWEGLPYALKVMLSIAEITVRALKPPYDQLRH